MPVVIRLSGVSGIAALTSRIRSHGSSRWKRTDTAMCVLEVKSSARKPTRSIVGAIASTSGVVRPVAPQRLWLPSRVVVSTISTAPLMPVDPEQRLAVPDQLRVLGADLDDRPGDPGGHRVHHLHDLDDADDVSGSTWAPTSTNGGAPGPGAR